MTSEVNYNFVVALVNKIFEAMESTNPSNYRYCYPTQNHIESGKKQWVMGLLESDMVNADKIKAGIAKLRSPETIYLPSIGQFIAMCSDDMPDVYLAFQEACRNSHPASNKTWSHDAIREASRLVGSHNLVSWPQDKAMKIFARCYEQAIKSFREGSLRFETHLLQEQEYRVANKETGQSHLERMKKILGR